MRGEIAIHGDDEAKPLATIPRVLDENIPTWHKAQLPTRTNPTLIGFLVLLEFRSSEFQPGGHRRLRGTQEDALRYALN